jgi:hypothetical protein
MTAIIFMGWAAWIGFATPQNVTETPLHANPHDGTNSGVSAPLAASGEATGGIPAVITAFSCDAHPANSMHPCGPFRDGTAAAAGLHGVVAACPYEHIGDTFVIDGFGAVLCRDTPRHPYLNGLIHLDLFMSYPAAVEWGIQTREVRRIE